MRREYDFSKAVRGKFYRKGAELRLPIYLDPKLQSKLERIARRKGKDVTEISISCCGKTSSFLKN
jgi:cytidylate kinase